MLVGKLLGWLVIGWAGVAAVFVLLGAVGLLIEDTERPFLRRLLRVLALSPLVAALCLIAWPWLLVEVWRNLSRERLRDRLLSGAVEPYPGEPPDEATWRKGDDPARLLRTFAGRLGRRRCRLIALACCRRLGPHLNHPALARALELAERGRGGATPEQRDEARRAVEAAANAALAAEDLPALAAAQACLWCLDGNAPAAVAAALHAGAGPRRPERAAQMAVLRDVAGDPFAPPAPRAFPAELRELARAIDAGDRALYPLLADALAELGEEAAACHCRQPEHWGGCHVVDWVLGRDLAPRPPRGRPAAAG